MEWSRWNASNSETPQTTKAAKYGKLPITVYTQKAKPAKPKLPISPHNWSGAKVSCQGAIDESHTHMWYFTVLSNITRNLITHLPLPLQRVPPTWELYKYARSIKCKRPDNVCCSHLASFDSATCIFMTRKKQNRSSLRDRCCSIRPQHNASLLFGVVNKTALLSSFHIPPPSGI